MGAHYSGQLYQFDSVPVSSGLPLTLPFRRGGYERGMYIFVGPDGSDGNDGLSWDQRVLTITQAITIHRTYQAGSDKPRYPDSVIVIAPGEYTDTITTMAYGAHFLGLGHCADKAGDYGVNIKSATPISGVHSVANTFENIRFESTGAAPAVDFNVINYTRFINCWFCGAYGTTASAFRNSTSALMSEWRNCRFSDAAIGFELGEAGVDVPSGWFQNLIEGCWFHYLSAAGFYAVANTPGAGSLINNCQIGDAATTLALGVDMNLATIAISNTNIQATAIDPASAGGGYYNNVYLNGALVTQT